MKLAVLTFFFSCLNLTLSALNWNITPIHAFGIGAELIEPISMFSPMNRPNFALGGYYKPYRFATLNASFFYNKQSWESNSKSAGMTKYTFRGSCYKIGPELSIGIRPMNKYKKRIGLAYNICFLNFMEEAHIIFREPVWGNLEKDFKTPYKKFVALEYDFTYQIESKRWLYKFQIYTMFNNSSRKISNEQQLIEGHKAEYVPGFSSGRGGVNFFVYFKL